MGFLSGVVLFVVPLVTQPAGFLFPVWVFVVSAVMLVNRPTDLAID